MCVDERGAAECSKIVLDTHLPQAGYVGAVPSTEKSAECAGSVVNAEERCSEQCDVGA